MMKRISSVAVLAALSLSTLAACQSGHTPQPRATLFEATEQNVLSSASHWNVLADNEAAGIKEVVPESALVSLPERNSAGSPFEQSYRDMLTSSLIANDVDVATSVSGAVYKLDYNIQVVKHTDRDSLLPRPGTASGVFAIGAVAANIDSWRNQSLALIPVALGLDAFTLFWRDTEGSVSEVVVNTRVSDGVRIVASTSNVYYFRGADEHNFTGAGKSFRVTSGGN